MELKLVDGDYVSNSTGAGFETVTDYDELLQRALYKLTARRGMFPLIPDLGSGLWTLCREKRSNRQSAARQYAAEALADEAGIGIVGVDVEEDRDRLKVHVRLSYEGDIRTVTVEVTE